MNLSTEMQTALATAARQWSEAMRRHERAARELADAETQLALAQRDLHELSRAIEIAAGSPIAALAPELVSQHVENGGTPIGAVTMPIVPAAPPSDGVDAATIVLQEMQRQRGMGMP